MPFEETFAVVRGSIGSLSAGPDRVSRCEPRSIATIRTANMCLATHFSFTCFEGSNVQSSKNM